MSKLKEVRWLGDSRTKIQEFSRDVRMDLGADLFRLQNGLPPLDWKPFVGLKRPAYELRAKDESGIFRVIYVTLIKERIYVLHCFQKKSQKTAKEDINIANQRLLEVKKND